jgi:hypothetical protein
MAWKGYEEDKWSGKKSDKRWFPFSVDKHDVKKVEDISNEEETLVFFEFNDQTGKINRIGNLGKTNNKYITVRIRNEQTSNPNWTRIYYITPDKDGIDQSLIDLFVNVKDFYLVKDKGKWSLDSNTSITITDEDI